MTTARALVLLLHRPPWINHFTFRLRRRHSSSGTLSLRTHTPHLSVQPWPNNDHPPPRHPFHIFLSSLPTHSPSHRHATSPHPYPHRRKDSQILPQQQPGSSSHHTFSVNFILLRSTMHCSLVVSGCLSVCVSVCPSDSLSLPVSSSESRLDYSSSSAPFEITRDHVMMQATSIMAIWSHTTIIAR